MSDQYVCPECGAEMEVFEEADHNFGYHSYVLCPECSYEYDLDCDDEVKHSMYQEDQIDASMGK